MNKHEVKFNNTREKIINSFFDILDYKNFEDISISELCLNSNIHRSTFYSHYNNTFEVLEDACDYLVKKFFSELKIEKSEENDNGDLLTKKYLIPYFSFIKRNAYIYKIYKKNLSAIKKDEYNKKFIDDVIKPNVKNKNDEIDKAIYSSAFFIGGIESIVNEWINNDFRESEEYLADLVVGLKRQFTI